MMNIFRERVAMMSRIKNEERWIERCVDSVWPVAERIVLWNDGSTDNTEICAKKALANHATDTDISLTHFGWIGSSQGPEGRRELHFINSMFTSAWRTKERVNEIRDKNTLWSYCKLSIPFDHMLCLDGDEALTQKAIRNFPDAIQLLEGQYDTITMPVIYLWDSEHQIRTDGIYGRAGDNMAQLRFPRLFTIKRVSQEKLLEMCFRWFGTNGGFHCGSVPQENFWTTEGKSGSQNLAAYDLPIVHYGYIDNPLRQAKFQFYNTIDPNNEGEGCYRHIIGEPDNWAPGPVQFEPWEDR